MPHLQTEVERFIRAQAQLEAKGRKREQENVEPPSGKAKQAKTSAPAPTEPGMFVLSPDGLQRCVIKEFKGQTYVDIRTYWKVRRRFYALLATVDELHVSQVANRAA